MSRFVQASATTEKAPALVAAVVPTAPAAVAAPAAAPAEAEDESCIVQ
jgi:hypothetical protein